MNKELSKSFDPKTIENKWYEFWESKGYYAIGQDDKKVDNFSILLPPPNVTGTLHMGHGFNQTLMDMLTRYHRMKGDNTRFGSQVPIMQVLQRKLWLRDS